MPVDPTALPALLGEVERQHSHSDDCYRANREMWDALADLAPEDRTDGDDDYRCCCYRRHLSALAACCRDLMTANEALKADAAAFRSLDMADMKDSERLDWLDAQRQPITDHGYNDADEERLIGYGWQGFQGEFTSVRAAIDAARQATEGREHD